MKQQPETKLRGSVITVGCICIIDMYKDMCQSTNHPI